MAFLNANYGGFSFLLSSIKFTFDPLLFSLTFIPLLCSLIFIPSFFSC